MYRPMRMCSQCGAVFAPYRNICDYCGDRFND